MKDTLRSVALCLVIPVIVVLLVVWVQRERGPYYLSANSDPEYAYLLNGLNIIGRETPAHTDHPGTTLQIYTALGIVITHQLAREGDVVDCVLKEPEFFLLCLQRGLLAFHFATSFALGIYVYRRTNHKCLSLLAQSSPLLFTEVIVSLARYFPENLILSFANLFVIYVLKVADDREGVERNHVFNITMVGVLGAALCVTKVIAVPLALIPFFVLCGLRSCFWYCLSFLIASAVLLMPVYSRFPAIIDWLMTNAMHSGRYGHGAKGFLELGAYIQNLKAVYVGFPILAVGFVFSVLSLLLMRRHSIGLQKFVLGVIVANVLILVFVLKSPASHYLVPILATQGPLVFCLFNALIPWVSTTSRSFLKYGSFAVLLSAIMGSVFANHRRLSMERGSVQSSLLAAKSALRLSQNGVLISTYRSSSQSYALAFGNTFAGMRFTPILKKLYPYHFDYNPWGDCLSAFSYADESVSSVNLGASAYIHGTEISDAVLSQVLKRFPEGSRANLEFVFGAEKFFKIEIPAVR